MLTAALINIWQGTQCAAGGGGPTSPCDFCDALIVSNNVIQDLFKLSLIVGGLMIVVGGVMMVVSAGNENIFKKGKSTLIRAVAGVVIALVSWLVVGTAIHVITGNANFPWNQISCKHNPAYAPAAFQSARSSSNNNSPNNSNSSGIPCPTGVASCAAIANDGTFACGTQQQNIQGAPANAQGQGQVFAVGAWPFNYDSYCGMNAITALAEGGWRNYTLAKKDSNGAYVCSPSKTSCNDIPGVNASDSCFVVLLSQCSNNQ